ncbi:hypothetical protein [Dorea formicigenerans]|uniref:hypothetical protein n=1 Tax=Dorea formicigenerans TaxID=39486 RepID=UPI0032C06408
MKRYYFSHAYYENGGYEIEIAYTGEQTEIEWGIRGRLEQLFPQITDVAAHRITFISDCVLAPYSLINLLIGKDTVSVCHQKAEDFIFLHCQLNLLIVTIYFSLVHVNFKTGK